MKNTTQPTVHVVHNLLDFVKYPNSHFTTQFTDQTCFMYANNGIQINNGDTLKEGKDLYTITKVVKSRKVIPEIHLESLNPYIHRSSRHFEVLVTKQN